MHSEECTQLDSLLLNSQGRKFSLVYQLVYTIPSVHQITGKIILLKIRLRSN